MRTGAAHNGDDERRTRQPRRLDRDLIGCGVGAIGAERRADDCARLGAGLAREHDESPRRQLAVVGHARAFVGTYGGFSYLAPFVGVDTIAFYSHVTGFRFDHLEVAKRIFSALRLGTFVELDLRAEALLRLGFGHPADPRTLVGQTAESEGTPRG